jgi:hypothetical protein
MANKIWANFHGVYLVGMSMHSSSRRQIGDEAHHPWREYVLSSGCQVALCARYYALPHNDAALDQEAADLIDGARPQGASAHDARPAGPFARCFDHHEAHGWSLHGSAIASAGDDITDRDTDLGVAGEREAAAGAVDRYQNRVEPDCLVFIDKAKTWRPSIAAEASRPFASAGLAHLLLNRFQPVPESAI